MKKQFKILALIIFIIFIPLLLGAGCDKKEEEKNKNIKDDVEKYSLFKNTDLKVTFEYPSDWYADLYGGVDEFNQTTNCVSISNTENMDQNLDLGEIAFLICQYKMPTDINFEEHIIKDRPAFAKEKQYIQLNNLEGYFMLRSENYFEMHILKPSSNKPVYYEIVRKNFLEDEDQAENTYGHLLKTIEAVD